MTDDQARRDEVAAHPTLTHRDGSSCIWVDGEWFVPLDAGGEGYPCPQDHPVSASLLARMLADARAEALREAAEAWQPNPDAVPSAVVRSWLRDRADAARPHDTDTADSAGGTA